MGVDDVTDDESLPAGSLTGWLAEMQAALRGERDAAVPCGGCTACCRSSQFVHIGPDETDTLAHIPAGLAFPAPGLPAGHVVVGYDERGHCPMLVDGGCSIYQHRPRTCRTYDCRIFAATGVAVDDAGQPGVAQRVRRWRFDVSARSDAVLEAAVRAAATFVRLHREALPEGDVPVNPVQHAVLAVRLHPAFIDAATGRATAAPEPGAVQSLLAGRSAR